MEFEVVVVVSLKVFSRLSKIETPSSFLALLSLDHLHVGAAALGRISLGEVVDAQSVTVEASKSDELPAVAQLGQVPDEGLHLSVAHARGVPVEGWAVVVGQLRGLVAKRRLRRLHGDSWALRSLTRK